LALFVAHATRAEGTRRALLIGINDYQALPKLNGAVNDVENIQGLLVTRYGFPEAQVRTLVDREATRAGILAALEQLVEEVGREDTVYLHYSGHGSQVADADLSAGRSLAGHRRYHGRRARWGDRPAEGAVRHRGARLVPLGDGSAR
jgi:uncharacterized caspase-like protein